MRDKRILAGTLASIAILMIGVLAVPGNVSAGDGPKIVRGWVWDNAGHNITGANVLIEIKNTSNWETRASLTDTTDDKGFYSVTFGFSDWYSGDSINITVTWEGKQLKNNTTAVSARPVQFVNATYPFEIPDLGSVAGFAIAGVFLGAIAIFLIVRRKKE